MAEKSDAKLRTERRLRKAFTELLCEKSYSSITVKELADRAEMSRATFYLHFDSIYSFSLYCKKYLIEELSHQLLCFLDNREKLDEVCKRSNLLISLSDRKLFMQFYLQEIYFSEDMDFLHANPYFIDFFVKRFSEIFVSENIIKINFFIRSYTVTLMELFCNYSKERALRELHYTFLVWDKLFPDNKI